MLQWFYVFRSFLISLSVIGIITGNPHYSPSHRIDVRQMGILIGTIRTSTGAHSHYKLRYEQKRHMHTAFTSIMPFVGWFGRELVRLGVTGTVAAGIYAAKEVARNKDGTPQSIVDAAAAGNISPELEWKLQEAQDHYNQAMNISAGNKEWKNYPLSEKVISEIIDNHKNGKSPVTYTETGAKPLTTPIPDKPKSTVVCGGREIEAPKSTVVCGGGQSDLPKTGQLINTPIEGPKDTKVCGGIPISEKPGFNGIFQKEKDDEKKNKTISVHENPITKDNRFSKTPSSHPAEFVKLKNGQGWRCRDGHIWKLDPTNHAGKHWDVADKWGNRVKEVADKDGKVISENIKNKAGNFTSTASDRSTYMANPLTGKIIVSALAAKEHNANAETVTQFIGKREDITLKEPVQATPTPASTPTSSSAQVRSTTSTPVNLGGNVGVIVNAGKVISITPQMNESMRNQPGNITINMPIQTSAPSPAKSTSASSSTTTPKPSFTPQSSATSTKSTTSTPVNLSSNVGVIVGSGKTVHITPQTNLRMSNHPNAVTINMPIQTSTQKAPSTRGK